MWNSVTATEQEQLPALVLLSLLLEGLCPECWVAPEPWTPHVSVPAAPSSAIRPFWSSQSCYPRNSVSVGKSSAISSMFSPRFPSLTPSSCCLLGAGEYEAVMSTTQMTMICSQTKVLSIIFFFSVSKHLQSWRKFLFLFLSWQWEADQFWSSSERSSWGWGQGLPHFPVKSSSSFLLGRLVPGWGAGVGTLGTGWWLCWWQLLAPGGGGHLLGIPGAAEPIPKERGGGRSCGVAGPPLQPLGMGCVHQHTPPGLCCLLLPLFSAEREKRVILLLCRLSWGSRSWKWRVFAVMDPGFDLEQPA